MYNDAALTLPLTASSPFVGITLYYEAPASTQPQEFTYTVHDNDPIPLTSNTATVSILITEGFDLSLLTAIFEEDVTVIERIDDADPSTLIPIDIEDGNPNALYSSLRIGVQGSVETFTIADSNTIIQNTNVPALFPIQNIRDFYDDPDLDLLFGSGQSSPIAIPALAWAIEYIPPVNFNHDNIVDDDQWYFQIGRFQSLPQDAFAPDIYVQRIKVVSRNSPPTVAIANGAGGSMTLAITVDDPDAGSEHITVTLNASGPITSIGGSIDDVPPMTVVVSGSGVSYSLTGPFEDINTVLSNLTFTSNGSPPLSGLLAVEVNDNGHAGTEPFVPGGAQEAVTLENFTIDVDAFGNLTGG